MIREFTEEQLQEFSKEEVDAFFEDYFSVPVAPFALDIFEQIRRASPKEREAVFRLLDRQNLLCGECGATSCLHGYSDE